MLLYLLRHGDAQSDASIADQDRALTSEGVGAGNDAARAIQLLDLAFDTVYSSPLLRARHMAELALSQMLNKPTILLTDHLRVGTNFKNLFDLLNSHSPEARVLLVGHEPYFSQLISTLVVGTLDARVDIRKASFSCVDIAHPARPKSGTLKWLIPPQVMRRIR